MAAPAIALGDGREVPQPGCGVLQVEPAQTAEAVREASAAQRTAVEAWSPIARAPCWATR